MSNEFVIVDGISIENLNPRNYALKNDYMNNMITTACLILPTVSAVIMEQIIITTGYVSNSYMTSKGNVTQDQFKHTKGLAYQFTWHDWDNDVAMQVALALFNNPNIDEGIKIIINLDTKRMFVGRGYQRKEIIEIANGTHRIVRHGENVYRDN